MPMSTCLIPSDQLGKTSGIIVWRGRICPRTLEFPNLVFDLDSWARAKCSSLLGEAQIAFLEGDYTSAGEYESQVAEISAWLQTHEGLISTDDALLGRCRIEPFVVDKSNFERWMDKLVALGHELEYPQFDFLLLADMFPPVLYSVTTASAVKHCGQFLQAALVSQTELEDKVGTLMLLHAKIQPNMYYQEPESEIKPNLRIPISMRWWTLWRRVTAVLFDKKYEEANCVKSGDEHDSCCLNTKN